MEDKELTTENPESCITRRCGPAEPAKNDNDGLIDADVDLSDITAKTCGLLEHLVGEGTSARPALLKKTLIIESGRCDVPSYIYITIPPKGPERDSLLAQANAHSLGGLMVILSHFAADEEMEIEKNGDPSCDVMTVIISRKPGVKYHLNLDSRHVQLLNGLGENFCRIMYLSMGNTLPPAETKINQVNGEGQKPRDVVKC